MDALLTLLRGKSTNKKKQQLADPSVFGEKYRHTSNGGVPSTLPHDYEFSGYSSVRGPSLTNSWLSHHDPLSMYYHDKSPLQSPFIRKGSFSSTLKRKLLTALSSSSIPQKKYQERCPYLYPDRYTSLPCSDNEPIYETESSITTDTDENYKSCSSTFLPQPDRPDRINRSEPFQNPLPSCEEQNSSMAVKRNVSKCQVSSDIKERRSRIYVNFDELARLSDEKQHTQSKKDEESGSEVTKDVSTESTNIVRVSKPSTSGSTSAIIQKPFKSKRCHIHTRKPPVFHFPSPPRSAPPDCAHHFPDFVQLPPSHLHDHPHPHPKPPPRNSCVSFIKDNSMGEHSGTNKIESKEPHQIDVLTISTPPLSDRSASPMGVKQTDIESIPGPNLVMDSQESDDDLSGSVTSSASSIRKRLSPFPCPSLVCCSPKSLMDPHKGKYAQIGKSSFEDSSQERPVRNTDHEDEKSDIASDDNWLEKLDAGLATFIAPTDNIISNVSTSPNNNVQFLSSNCHLQNTNEREDQVSTTEPIKITVSIDESEMEKELNSPPLLPFKKSSRLVVVLKRDESRSSVPLHQSNSFQSQQLHHHCNPSLYKRHPSAASAMELNFQSSCHRRSHASESSASPCPSIATDEEDEATEILNQSKTDHLVNLAASSKEQTPPQMNTNRSQLIQIKRSPSLRDDSQNANRKLTYLTRRPSFSNSGSTRAMTTSSAFMLLERPTLRNDHPHHHYSSKIHHIPVSWNRISSPSACIPNETEENEVLSSSSVLRAYNTWSFHSRELPSSGALLKSNRIAAKPQSNNSCDEIPVKNN